MTQRMVSWKDADAYNEFRDTHNWRGCIAFINSTYTTKRCGKRCVRVLGKSTGYCETHLSKGGSNGPG